ncbi:hypothetical protein [Priestia endophytica]|uniref:Uncharacterized protein n=1 Tax=Priestia endophytica DSM 13796 TaxID=1121089 RepID=A0A1I6C6R4_9BACI|nr:hypothetical protein [Priestia endophytica]KYG29178.1 hypothetical protein AZF06_24920 [Priestia endophytica]SFQ88867.1 hypothetical protein SAMN02745910_05151 [Priestia endophytica DSM 13796]
MDRIFKFLKTFSNGNYKDFAKQLGFASWNEVMESTFEVFRIPPDASYYATRLSKETWIVWNDEGHPPYSFSQFDTWYEAIEHLRTVFEEEGYPEEFDTEEDVFNNVPDESKRIQ